MDYDYTLLFLLVEGPDDERFFNKIILPELEKRNVWVKFYNYSTVKQSKINKFLKSLQAMNADYIFFADINHVPCVTLKKEKIEARYPNLDCNKIIIVVKEIESWYLAGLSKDDSKKLMIKPLDDTNKITKEIFDKLIPKNFTSRIDFMREVLNSFKIDVATKKNKSLRYFTQKYHI